MAEAMIKENVTRKCIYCPECLDKGLQMPVKRFQLSDEYYLVLCTDKDNCSFHESGEGEAQVNIEDLVDCGLPGQLLEFMDVYQEDLNKIVCLGFYEHFINNLSLAITDSMECWKEAERLFQRLASFHQLNLKLSIGFDRDPLSFQMLKNALELSVADLTLEYKTIVKDAFMRIENYKFPEDFVNYLLSKNKSKSNPMSLFVKTLKNLAL